MSDVTPENIRQLLLGELRDETIWQEIERKLLAETAFAEEVEICEDELIDRYLAENLTANEQAAFENYFLQSPEMRERLAFARELKIVLQPETKPQSLAQPTKRKSFFSFGFPTFLPVPALAALALIFVGIAGFAVWQMFLGQTELDKGLVALQREYGDKRPFQARVTGFSYAPLQVTRGATDENSEDTLERDRIERMLLDVAAARKDAPAFYALGKFYLVEKNFDKALAQFEKAARLSSNDARLSSDLGAALLESGRQTQVEGDAGKSLELVGRSLEYSEKAVALNPQLLDPRFNRALCLELMSAFNTAKEAWREYLQLDSTSEWAEEARRSLEQLEQKVPQQKSGGELLQDFLAAFRRSDKEKAWEIQNRNKEMITGKLIPQQLAKFFLESSIPSEKAEYLAALRFSADLEAAKGDLYFLELANFYAAQPPDKTTVLLDAQKKVFNAYELVLQGNFPQARADFLAARGLFEKIGNHWEVGLTDYWIAYLDYELVQVESSKQRLLNLAGYCRPKNYKWLCSQTYNWLAVAANAQRELSAAVSYAETSLELSQQIEDAYLSEKTLAWLINSSASSGQYRKGFVYLPQLLALSSLPTAAPRQRSRDFDAAAKIFFFMRRYHEAHAFAREWHFLSQQKPRNPSAERTAGAFLATVLANLQRYDEALQFIERSLEIAAIEPNDKTRLKSQSFITLQLANIERLRGDCQKAYQHYDETIQMYANLNFELNAHEAHLGRLLCSVQNTANARQAIDSMLTLLEDNRSKIWQEQTRNNFFNNQQRVYDLAVNYEYQQNNFAAAFDYSEMSRSRSLLDLQNQGAQLIMRQNEPQIVFEEKVTEPLKLADLRPLIPAQVQIVQYAVLPDKIIVWLISAEKFETFAYAIKSDALQDKTFDFIAALKKNDETVAAQATELNRILFEQVAARLDADKTICLIPDKFLFHLPFAALVSARTNKYLIEEFQILTAPSLNVFLAASRSAETRGGDAQTENLLSVGNPAFDKREFRNLADLPSAETEAIEIASLYSQQTTLLKENAVQNQILTAMQQADVIHFAGHYVANENSPLLSSFLVAGTGEAGILTNFEILQQRLTRPRLIVLSACQTEMEGYLNGEGMIGAGRTFLAAGVPLLVATQWKVESDSTAELMKKFHRLRKQENLPTVAALQRAQREMLQQENFRQPYYWAGFTVLGGYAQF